MPLLPPVPGPAVPLPPAVPPPVEPPPAAVATVVAGTCAGEKSGDATPVAIASPPELGSAHPPAWLGSGATNSVTSLVPRCLAVKARRLPSAANVGLA